MKSLKQLYSELQQREDFKVLQISFDGGAGVFTSGTMRKMTVIWRTC